MICKYCLLVSRLFLFPVTVSFTEKGFLIHEVHIINSMDCTFGDLRTVCITPGHKDYLLKAVLPFLFRSVVLNQETILLGSRNYDLDL